MTIFTCYGEYFIYIINLFVHNLVQTLYDTRSTNFYSLKFVQIDTPIEKQEAHGPHRSPEKPVQINEYI